MLMRGFTLVELMVAMALGLVVVGAALGFLAQLLRATGETVASVRLQQEVGAVMGALVAEVQRARASGDAIALAPACFRDGGGVVRLHAGRVERARGPGRDCTSAGVPLHDGMHVTSLEFTHDAARNDRRVEIVLSATWRSPAASLRPRVATVRRVVALRSNGG